MNCVWFLTGLILCFSFISSSCSKEDSLLIGSFNIQIFGKTKSEDAEVMDILVKILSRYDLAVILEIRDSHQEAFPELCRRLNEANKNAYEHFAGRRVGRTASKEQYGFIYKKEKLGIKSLYQREDEYDVFEREPVVVRFQRIDDAGKVKEFTFIPMHAKPKDAIGEMNSLVAVYEEAEKLFGPNAVIAGDLNADCSYVCKSCWDQVKLRSDPRFYWMISGDVDTTVAKSSCAYDRIILVGKDMEEHACCADVYRFDEKYDLTHDVAADVSDHYPVEFTLN